MKRIPSLARPGVRGFRYVSRIQTCRLAFENQFIKVNVDGRHVSAHVHTCCDTYLAKSLITPVIYPVFLLYNTPLSVNSV